MSAAMTKEERERLVQVLVDFNDDSSSYLGTALDEAVAELRRTADYDELREKNVAAMQSLAEWDDRVAQLQARCEAAEHERDELRARLEAAEKDAERYRLLRSHGTMLPRLNTAGAYVTFCIGLDWIQEFTDAEFDCAVDALSPTDAGVTTRGGGE